jgi:hypothetical protein
MLQKDWNHASRNLAEWLNCSRYGKQIGFQCIFNHWHWFQAQVSGSTLSQMGQMKKDAKEQHEQLVTLLETDSDLTSSDRSSVSTNYNH